MKRAAGGHPQFCILHFDFLFGLRPCCRAKCSVLSVGQIGYSPDSDFWCSKQRNFFQITLIIFHFFTNFYRIFVFACKKQFSCNKGWFQSV